MGDEDRAAVRWPTQAGEWASCGVARRATGQLASGKTLDNRTAIGRLEMGSESWRIRADELHHPARSRFQLNCCSVTRQLGRILRPSMASIPVIIAGTRYLWGYPPNPQARCARIAGWSRKQRGSCREQRVDRGCKARNSGGRAYPDSSAASPGVWGVPP